MYDFKRPEKEDLVIASNPDLLPFFFFAFNRAFIRSKL